MTAPTILIKDKALVEWLERICTVWAAAHPEQYRLWRKYCQWQRSQLRSANGMSANKHLAYEGSIPTAVYDVVAAKVKEFWLDHRNVDLAIKMLMGEYRPE